MNYNSESGENQLIALTVLNGELRLLMRNVRGSYSSYGLWCKLFLALTRVTACDAKRSRLLLFLTASYGLWCKTFLALTRVTACDVKRSLLLLFLMASYGLWCETFVALTDLNDKLRLVRAHEVSLGTVCFGKMQNMEIACLQHFISGFTVPRYNVC